MNLEESIKVKCDYIFKSNSNLNLEDLTVFHLRNSTRPLMGGFVSSSSLTVDGKQTRNKFDGDTGWVRLMEIQGFKLALDYNIPFDEKMKSAGFERIKDGVYILVKKSLK